MDSAAGVLMLVPSGNKCPFTSLANPSNFHRITGITGQHLPPLVYIPPFQQPVQRQIAEFKHFHVDGDSDALQQKLEAKPNYI